MADLHALRTEEILGSLMTKITKANRSNTGEPLAFHESAPIPTAPPVQKESQASVNYLQRWPTAFGEKPHSVMQVQQCLTEKFSPRTFTPARVGPLLPTVENWVAHPVTAKGNLRRLPGYRELTVDIPSHYGLQTYLVSVFNVSASQELVRVDALTELQNISDLDRTVLNIQHLDLIDRADLLPCTRHDIETAVNQAFNLTWQDIQPQPSETPDSKPSFLQRGAGVFGVERCVLRAAATELAALRMKKYTPDQQLEYFTQAILKINRDAVVCVQSPYLFINLLEMAIFYIRQRSTPIQLVQAPPAVRALRRAYAWEKKTTSRLQRYRNLLYHPHMLQPVTEGANKAQLREIARAFHTLRSTDTIPKGYGMLALRSEERHSEDSHPEIVAACAQFTAH